jgi:hypothetical protein
MGTGFSQNIDDYIEMLRSDLKTQKTALISEHIELSEAESEKFWPVYRKYALKLDKISDERVTYIKEFADNYDTMTDKKADKIIKQAFDFYKDRRNLEKDLYGDSKKILGAVKAAKLIQLEHQVNILIDLQISSELPLIEKTSKTTDKK